MTFFVALSGLMSSVVLGLSYGAREATLAAVATALALAIAVGRR